MSRLADLWLDKVERPSSTIRSICRLWSGAVIAKAVAWDRRFPAFPGIYYDGVCAVPSLNDRQERWQLLRLRGRPFPGGRLDLRDECRGEPQWKERKMAARHSSLSKLPGGEELVITRVFDVPRDAVWEAWTDPTRFMLWWGPKGFTSPACKIDLRVGGKYLACMRSPEGQTYWSTGVYREIVPEEKIVYTDSFSDAKGNVVPASHYGMSGDWPSEMLVTVTFQEDGSETIMTLRHDGIPPEMISDCETGWSESFDKLAVVLHLE